MASMQPETTSELDERAQAVGQRLGWPLRFRAAPGDLFVGLTVSTARGESVISNYTDFGEAAPHAAHWDLDRLELEQYKMHPDSDRVALVRFLTPDEIIAMAEGRESR